MPQSNPEPPSDRPPASPPDQAESPNAGQGTGRNPGAGCIIIVVALLSLSFLVGFGIWNLFKLDKELAKFTEAEAKPTPVPDLEENAAAVNILNSKLETFTTDQGNKRPATLTVTADEINLALAAFAEFEELRETFSVREIKDGQLFIAISFPLRGNPTKGGEFRYLNGTMVATPELAGGEIILDVARIEVPGKTVPDGFLGQLSPYRVTERYLEDETLGPWMKRLTSLTVEDGKLALTIEPSATPPESEPVKLEKGHIVRAMMVFGGRSSRHHRPHALRLHAGQGRPGRLAGECVNSAGQNVPPSVDLIQELPMTGRLKPDSESPDGT